MKRVFLVVAVLATVFVASPAHATEKWHPGNGYGPCSGWFSYVRPAMGFEEVAHRVELTIRCADKIWPVDLDYTLAIAERESGKWPWAYNPSGCSGIFQHQIRYWAGRVHDYIHRDWYAKWRWDKGISVFDMRANVLVAVQMMHRLGYDAWT